MGKIVCDQINHVDFRRSIWMMNNIKVGFFIVLKVIVFLVILNISSNKLEDIDHYRIYYDEINKEIIQDMRNYDLLIVEGLHFTKQDVEKIKKDNHTVILGYLSVMEIGHWDEKLLNKLFLADYLLIDGKRVINNKYGNYLGDISSIHYQDILMDTLSTRILSKGMDGIFLDTVDGLDQYSNDSMLYHRLLTGYEQFLMKVRKKYPDITIIQNRGFESLVRVSNEYIDGVLWEDFHAPTVDAREIIKNRVKLLNKIRKDKKLVIFTESYGNEQENTTYAKKMGWIHFQNRSSQYDDWFNM